MILGISPTVDFAFKLLLGSPEHVAITIHFLNAVLGGFPRITAVRILNPFLGKGSAEDKLGVLDILAKDEFGRWLNIEMQTSLPSGLSQRLTYYATKLYANQLNESDSYTTLRPVISICVLERALFPQRPQLHLDFRLRDEKGALLTDDLQIHLVELQKSRATAHNINEVSPLERWAYFLLNAERMTAEALRALLPEPVFVEAVGVLEMIGRTPEQEQMYNARAKLQRDELSKVEFARMELEAARAEGKTEGEQMGREKGRVEGELIGQARLLEQLLNLSQSTADDLAKLGESQLTAKIDELQRRLRGRMPTE